MLSSLAAKRALAPSMVVFTRGFFVLCLSLLMSCGGGGGGDDGGGGDNFRVTLNRTSLSWTYLEGSSPGAQSVTGTATGEYDGPLFVAAIVENNGAVNAINPNIPITIIDNQATAELTPVANLPQGTYTGRVLFLACSDQACNNRIGGTPLAVTFTVTVQIGVRATPSSITRSVESGTGVLADITVTPGTTETGFTVLSLDNFVQVTNQTAGGFRVTLPSLPVGTYLSSIAVTGSGGSRTLIPITYTVTPPPGGQHGLTVSPSSVTFDTTEGASAAAQVVEVTEPTWRPGLLAPTVEYLSGQDWLGLTPVAGGYRLTASAANLSSGTYTARVLFRNNLLPQGMTEPFTPAQVVSVSVTVGPGLVRPADVLTRIDSETNPAALSGNVHIDLVGGPPATWNAASDVSWLAVTSSGVTGSALTYSIDPTWLSTAENFADYEATIAVSAPGTPITPTSFQIRVERRLAEVTGVGAHIQLTGQPTQLVVSGRGFAAITNPTARVGTTAASHTSVQRVSDTKLLVSFDSLSVGPHVVSVGNALGISTASGSAIAVSSTSYPYDTVASGGPIAHLAIDHETGTLYGVRLGATPDQGTLVRFRPNGGNWTADSPSIAAVGNVGVLNDGNVIVNTVPGGITILDRDTMNSTFNLDLTCTGLHHKSQNMPVTLDGRVWLSHAINPGCAGNPRSGELGWFDPTTQTFQMFETPNEPWFVQRFADGPSFVMSRNGERLVMHQESNQNFPPMVYLEASHSVLRPTPQDQPNWLQAATSSDDGSRMLFDHDRVVNEQFATVGRVVLPAYSTPFPDPALPAASVLSPDGTRAYVLTNPVSYIGQSPTPATPLPRVWVLDTSGDVGDAALPVLGYFELDDAPSCLTGFPCEYRPRVAISIDGTTLFLAGDLRLVVAPIPSTLQNAGVSGMNGSRMQTKAKPWRLPKN